MGLLAAVSVSALALAVSPVAAAMPRASFASLVPLNVRELFELSLFFTQFLNQFVEIGCRLVGIIPKLDLPDSESGVECVPREERVRAKERVASVVPDSSKSQIDGLSIL